VPFKIENQSKFAFFVTTEPDCNVTGIVFPAPQGVVSWFDHGTHFLVATEDIYRLPWDKTNWLPPPPHEQAQDPKTDPVSWSGFFSFIKSSLDYHLQ
jgi:hypothetical protein